MAGTPSLTQPLNIELTNFSSKDEKCCKKAKTATSDEKNDHISKLPDAILSQILSSFTTKEVVRTSILSKQWRYIWTLVPNLDFDDGLFMHNKERNDIEIENCFRCFVTRVLGLHRVPSIHKFRFSFRREYGFLCVSDWISNAITRKIEEMDVSLCVDWQGLPKKYFDDERLWQVLPQKFFTNEKLVVLRLHRVALILPASVHFPSLKTLFLGSVKSTYETSMKSLLSGCPVLEKLEIDRDDWDDVATLYISSPSLKSLKVDCSLIDQGGEEYKIVIESPNLQYLQIEDRVIEDFRVTRSPSLEKVFLDLGQSVGPFLPEDVYASRLCNLLRILSNMKDLNITSRFFLDMEFDDLPVLHNLRSLTFAFTFNVTSGDILIQLLEHSPNLQTLYVIENDYIDSPQYVPEENAIQWDSPSLVPGCLHSCLEIFEISYFEGYDGGMKMIEYFLENAMVLKKMIIKSKNLLDLDTKSEILMFPRSSNTCEVEISYSP